MNFVPSIVPKVDAALAALADILTYRRRDRSKAERAVIRKYITPLGAKRDSFGNLILRIDGANEFRSRVMFSCHVDTVHKMGGRQRIKMARGVIALAEAEKDSNCLGADCGAGLWIMREMILARVPGLYVFHRAEESGGYGSDHIAAQTPELIADIDACIAFDRRGTNEVITHQMVGRCASDAFAWSLADMLGADFKPSDRGSFTDSANYAHLIPECSNVSVGYAKEHSRDESLDVAHLLDLRDAMLSFDETRLVIERDHAAPDPDEAKWSNYLASDNDERFEDWRAHESLEGFVKRNPEAIAAWLEGRGYNAISLATVVFGTTLWR